MSVSRIHLISIEPVRRIGGEVYFRAIYDYGYQSGLHGYPGHAEAAGRDHKNAKEGRQ